MVNLQAFTRWNSDLAKTVAAIGGDAFFNQLFSALADQVAHIYPQIWLYHRDLPPRILYHEIPADAVPMRTPDIAFNSKGTVPPTGMIKLLINSYRYKVK